MKTTYGARDIVRNPSLLKIAAHDSIVIEDKKSHKTLGIYLGIELANEFLEYRKKSKLLEAGRKIKNSASLENKNLEGTLDD